ncbi:PIHD2-like protein [Mya arenaria]|uniref:PIH1 domain-containing protein 2 n=1 Tax=Mya arenaria TaxID=6604 RepID=A0ABY7E3U3_MYAAR|nr:PIH1 domain-containing protein 2-like [Mya arenaria]XP_052807085.1 PIH1 domain-containing protein 2-like [Mya arenaria]XP_052807086.1 PIH1 domain-containing protein 2-like [Mya arenaria]XP_052807087.1 PIH1 domain-containing protein 2-like [Mya arenaria]WAR04668.1 PIHD2-like protein [Mya arenaria]
MAGTGEYSSEAMMQKASHIWSMLDDMADSDPSGYKKFIDKQMMERKEFMSPPEPHMCVQTWMTKPDNVAFYINFCTWKRIPEPANSEEPVKVAGSAVSQISDDRGKAAVTAVAFNQKVLDEFGRDPVRKSDQDILIQIAMDFIEKQHSHIKLNRKYKVLDRTHKGSVKMIQESLSQAFRTKDKDIDENLANMVKSFAPLATESPETLIGQLHKEESSENNLTTEHSFNENLSGIKLNTQPVKKGLIEEVTSNGSDASLPEPVYKLETSSAGDSLTLRLELPGVKSVTECELDISKDDVSLLVEDKYELKLSLPRTVDDARASAKFIKKTSTLTLQMPF